MSQNSTYLHNSPPLSGPGPTVTTNRWSILYYSSSIAYLNPYIGYSGGNRYLGPSNLEQVQILDPLSGLEDFRSN